MHLEKGLCLSVCVDDIKMRGKNNLNPMWEKLMKRVDLGEQATL